MDSLENVDIRFEGFKIKSEYPGSYDLVLVNQYGDAVRVTAFEIVSVLTALFTKKSEQP